MTTEKGNGSSEPSASERCRESGFVGGSKRLEDLLIDDREQASFRRLAQEEVRSLEPRRQVVLPLIIAAIVVGCTLLAGLYLYLQVSPVDPLAEIELTEGEEKRQPMPARPEPLPVAAVAEPLVQTPEPAVQPDEEIQVIDMASTPLPAVMPVAADDGRFRVLVGPFFQQSSLEEAVNWLTAQGFSSRSQEDTGVVTMIRLLEGIYPAEQARTRLALMRKDVPSVFILREPRGWALYLGSFADPERADRFQKELASRNISATRVETQVPMKGTLLDVLHADRQVAQRAAELISGSGMQARVEELR